jgi:energy-coupling factor transporter ATP-binding protein EcfA2
VRLTRLRLVRSPGIETPIELRPEQLDRPVVLVVGPNGSGKSSLCRAVSTLLWPERGQRHARLEVEASWARNGGRVEAAYRAESGTRWTGPEGVEIEPPPLPPPHLAPCFTPGALDLLKPRVDDHDAQLTALIRRELAGGYDLDGLVERCFAGAPRGGQTELREYHRAQHELQRLRLEEEKLAEREASLEELRERAASARAAAQRAERIDTQLELLDVRARLRERERALQREFPAGMDRLDGTEGRRLAELDGRAEEIEEDARQQRGRIEQAQRQLREAALDGAGPREEELEAHREHARRADELERRLAERESTLRRAAAARDRARRALGADVDAEHAPEVSGAAIDRAEELGAAREQAEARRSRISAELEALDPEPDEEAAEAREQAERLLEAWLVTPAGLGIPGPLAASATALGLALAGTWLWLAPEVGPLGWGIAGGAVVLTLGAWAAILARALASRRERERLRDRFERLPVTPPADWARGPVGERLEAVRRARAADARARQHAERRIALTRGWEQVGRELDAIHAEAEGLRETHGVRVPAGAARTATLLRLLADWQQAWREMEEAETDRAETLRQLAERLDRVGELLAVHGGERPADAVEAARGVDALAARTRRAAEARRTLEEAEAKLGELDSRRREVTEARQGLFTKLGLARDDVAGLQRRVEQLEGYREAVLELRRLADEQRRLAESLGPMTPDEQADPAALRAERDDARREAAGLDALSKEVHTIEALVDAARRAHHVQDAVAARDAARDRLLERRRELAHQAAGRVLTRHALERHRQERQPALLREASGLLARFTGYRYELEVVDTPEGGALRARDAERDSLLTPAQLSDGSRAQLLLAVRLAFAQSAEAGGPLPLLLDEALVASDPERFDAIAESLLELAADDGRQVLFLTSDPMDAARWDALIRQRGLDEVQPIDLVAVREEHRAATFPLPRLAAPEEPAPPGPDEDAHAYGRRLGVAAPDPWAGVEAWHPLHLWPDDLRAVHALVRHGLHSLGRWRAFRRHRPGDPGPLSPGRADDLDVAVSAAEAVVRAWRIGRGRALERDTLVRAEGVSEKFVDALWSKALELDRDAAALMKALRSREVKNFRQEKIDQLERELTDSGHLDARAALSREALIARARGALEARGLDDPGFTAVARLVDTILAWLR